MKYPKKKATGKSGVSFVESVVAKQGSIFRTVHEEDDLGIDGFIELVRAEASSGRLIAVQIKSGDSYLAQDGSEFVIPVDERHLDYWLGYMVPVILVCYSPSKNVAAWASVRDYVALEKYNDRLPVTQIRVPIRREFTPEAVGEGITGLANVRFDERSLLECADFCLSEEASLRRQGFHILMSHPSSRDSKVLHYFARKFISEPDDLLAKDALFVLGYGVGRRRWSWNPNNPDEGEVARYAVSLCRNFTEPELHRMLALCDDEAFRGPNALGERLFDVTCCCDDSIRVFDRISEDKTEPIRRRANALYISLDCDDERLEEAKADLLGNSGVGDVVAWMFRDESS